MRISSILLPLYLLPLVLSGQYQFENPVFFDREDGMPSHGVRSMVEDEHGFLWIGTLEGLCKFDGSHFKVYSHDPENPDHSLIHNSISSMIIDGKDLWIATSEGISVMDIATNQFRNYRFNKDGQPAEMDHDLNLSVPLIFQDHLGVIWIGTTTFGFAMYDPKSDGFEFFTYQGGDVLGTIPTPESVNAILSVESCEDNDSIIWAGSLAGLLELNRYTKKIEWYYFSLEDKKLEIAANTFRRIYYHDNGLLYVGSWNANMNIFDPSDHTLHIVDWDKMPGRPFPKSSVSNIRRIDSDEIWVTTGSGLARYNATIGEITEVWKRDLDGIRTYGADFVDSQNRFWKFDYNHLTMYNPILQQFAVHSYSHLNTIGEGFGRNVLPRKNGRILTVCAQDAAALFHFDRDSRTWSKTKMPQSVLHEFGKVNGFDMSISPGGDWTISTRTHLLNYDPENDRLSVFSFQPKVENVFISYLHWDKSGNLWISTERDGLLKWNPKTGKQKIYKSELESNDPFISTDGIWKPFEDSKGNIWIRRNGGISCYLAKKDTFLNFLTEINPENAFEYCREFAEDRQGRIWVTARSGWLGYILADEPEKGIIFKMELKKVDPRLSELTYMRVDESGDLWFLMEKYLIKMDPEVREPILYDLEYGLQDPTSWFFNILPSGEMIFGLRNAIAICDPSNLRKNEALPIPYITEINVREQPLVGDTIPYLLKQLNLSYKENFFSFDFSAIGFTLPEKNQFRYRLNGFDDHWVNARNRRNANFTNVPPGNYTFELQAANNEGMWNPGTLRLPITISTPWWMLWWVRLGMVLALVCLGYAAYRYRINQIRKEERLRSEFQKKLADVEMSALRAQMNPHFIFNCLNSIENYVIKNDTIKAASYLNDFARLIRLILQNSRSKLVVLEAELEALELYLEMESLRFYNRFEYHINVHPEVDTGNLEIPPMLIQPYVENAIWHGLMHKEESGKLAIELKRQNGILHCTIEDNGIGREKSREINQNRESRRRKSVGMQITGDRIHLLNELYQTKTTVNIIDLTDESGNASGTRVELEIPV